jgi:hypothetical protein
MLGSLPDVGAGSIAFDEGDDGVIGHVQLVVRADGDAFALFGHGYEFVFCHGIFRWVESVQLSDCLFEI